MMDKQYMSEPIRILQVIGIMNRGGAEAMIMNLYRNIDRTKVQFDFVENTFEAAAYDEEIRALGGKIYNCPHYTGKNHFQYKKWWHDFFEIHKGEYKIVHGHLGSTAAIYLDEAKKAGVFAIAHSHSSGTDRSLKSFLYKILSYPTRYIADYFFACSEIAGEDRFGQKTVLSSNHKVIRNAINAKDFQYNEEIRNDVRRQLGVEEKILIGHIGRFTREKNHKKILQVFKEILSRKYNCMLILIGDGPLKNEIEDYADRLNIASNIIFTGVRSDVNRLIQAMDCFIFPSLYEGLPVTLVETQTAGLPCVISDKVPAESILIKELVTVMKLDDSSGQWAEHILDRLNETRRDRKKEIVDAGYDVASTAKWLEAFYIEKSEQQ